MMTHRPKLIDGDCREELKKIPDSTVDLILTDPPYSISNPNAGEIIRNGGKYGHAKSIKADFGEWDHPENAPHLEDWVTQCVRVLKPTGIFISFYGNNKLQSLIEYLESLGMHFRQLGVWVKTNPCILPKTMVVAENLMKMEEYYKSSIPIINTKGKYEIPYETYRC